MAHLQHLTTPVTIQEVTERTIVVMNDDKDQEINTNTIMKHTTVEQQEVFIYLFPFLLSNISIIKMFQYDTLYHTLSTR